MKTTIAMMAMFVLLAGTDGVRAEDCTIGVENLRDFLDSDGQGPMYDVFIKPLYHEAAAACGAGNQPRSQHFLDRATRLSRNMNLDEMVKRSSRWKTDYGPAVLAVLGNTFAGTYKDWGGKFFGTMEGHKAEGIWYQSRQSEKICAEERYGTRNWGRFVFTFSGQSRFKGIWAYCDENPRRWGAWNGRRQSGTAPRPGRLD